MEPGLAVHALDPGRPDELERHRHRHRHGCIPGVVLSGEPEEGEKRSRARLNHRILRWPECSHADLPLDERRSEDAKVDDIIPHRLQLREMPFDRAEDGNQGAVKGDRTNPRSYKRREPRVLLVPLLEAEPVAPVTCRE